MKLTLGDKTYESDLGPLKEPSIGEARAIKRQTGLTITDWAEGLENLGRLDPDVLAGLVFLLRKRAGEPVDWAEIDSLSLADFAAGLSFDLTEGDKAAIAAAAAEHLEQPDATTVEHATDAEPEQASAT